MFLSSSACSLRDVSARKSVFGGKLARSVAFPAFPAPQRRFHHLVAASHDASATLVSSADQSRRSYPTRPESGPESQLTVSDIRNLLDEGGIDYRDCFEKEELVRRLRERRDSLPAHVQNRLQALLSRGGSGDASSAADPASSSAPLTNAEIDSLASGLFLDEQNTIALFRRTSPSVVHIRQVVQRPDRMGFWGGPVNLDPEEITLGSGSGFIWDREGHVVTNYHVIAQSNNGKSLSIGLSDGRSFKAEIRGTCPEKDIAVLKLKDAPVNSLLPITVGSSMNLAVGQRVFAIGNPFGLDLTMTQGIVSGTGRDVRGVGGNKIRGLVQTDASINPGNSGGPLLDSRGRLIGVNTMILSGSGTSSGVGFAVPSDTVRRVVGQICRYGKVQRSGLGVYLASNMQASMLGVRDGALIMTVVRGSPAEAAGLQGTTRDSVGTLLRGDVVVAVGAERIRTGEDLIAAVERFDPGDRAVLSVRRRNGNVEKVEVAVRVMMDM